MSVEKRGYIDHKPVIKEMIQELIENDRQHKHGRVPWFDHQDRIIKLEAIDDWLDAHSLDQHSEEIILSLLLYVCAHKDNPIALFAPHSLDEYYDLIRQNHLTVNPGIHFSYEELEHLVDEDGIEDLMEGK